MSHGSPMAQSPNSSSGFDASGGEGLRYYADPDQQREEMLRNLLERDHTIEVLARTLDATKLQLGTAVEDLNVLQHDKEVAMTQLSAVMEQCQLLKADKLKLEERVASQESSVSTATHDQSEARHQLDLALQQQQFTQEENARLSAELDRVRDQLEGLGGIAKQLQGRRTVADETTAMSHKADLAEVEEKMFALDRLLTQERMDSEQLRALLDNQTKEVSFVSKQRTEAEAMIQSLREKLYDTEREREDLLRRVGTLEVGVSMKDSEQQRSGAEVVELRTQLQEQFDVLGRVQPMNDMLQKDCESLRSALELAREEGQGHARRFRDVERQFADLQLSHQDVSTNLTVEAEQGFQIERERQRLQVECSSLRDKLDVAEEELAATSARLERAQQRKDAQKLDLTESYDKNDSLEDEVGHLNEQLRQILEAKHKFEAETYMLRDEVAEIRSVYSKREMEQQAESEALQQHLTSELRSERKTITDLETTLAGLRTKHAEVEVLAESRVASMQDLTGELEVSRAIEAELREINSNLSQDVELLGGELNAKSKELDDTVTELKAAKADLAAENIKLGQSKREARGFKQRLDAITASASENREQMVGATAKLEYESQRLQSALSEVTQLRQNEKRQVEVLKDSRQRSLDLKSETSRTVEQLEEKLKKEVQRCDRLQGKLNSVTASAARVEELKVQVRGLETEAKRVPILETELGNRLDFHRRVMERLGDEVMQVIHYFSQRSQFVEAQKQALASFQQRQASQRLIAKAEDDRLRSLSLDQRYHETALELKRQLLGLPPTSRDGRPETTASAGGADPLETAAHCDAVAVNLGYQSFDDLLYCTLAEEGALDHAGGAGAQDLTNAEGREFGGDPHSPQQASSPPPPVWTMIREERKLKEAVMLALGAQFIFSQGGGGGKLGAGKVVHNTSSNSNKQPQDSLFDMLRSCIDWWLPDPFPRGHQQ